MGYFITFTTERVKMVKGVRYFWIFVKFWILRFSDDFWPKFRFTLFGTLFTLFLAGVKKYYIFAISSTNISKIGQIAKKVQEIKILTHKKRQILYINCSRKTFVRDILFHFLTLKHNVKKRKFSKCDFRLRKWKNQFFVHFFV